MNSHNWANVGLSGSCVPSEDWQQFEWVFQANRDLPPAESRLAIFFASTGTLWIGDVVIENTAEPKRQWLPVIPMEGRTQRPAQQQLRVGRRTVGMLVEYVR